MKTTDCFIDIETTGTNPNTSAMFQIGAVKFNLMTGEIGETFKISLKMPKNRYWQEDTRRFWSSRLSLFNEIVKDEVDTEEGFRKFIEWVNKDTLNVRAWSKPLSFDLPFIASYCEQYNIANPFNHWEHRDLRSFMMAIYGENLPKLTMKDGLVEHDALADALNETLWLLDTWKRRDEICKQQTKQ